MGRPSKATATTICQKCLKKGHYSYECNSSQQDRPYYPRPSRTQQLLNPKLAPKIVEAPPTRTKIESGQRTPTVRKDDTHIVKSRGRRERSYPASSDSVATISTRTSSSRSPPPQRHSHERRRSFVDHRRPDRRRSRSAHRFRSPARHSNHSYGEDPRRDVRSRSRSPFGGQPARSSGGYKNGQPKSSISDSARVRSLSPYSKRVAMSHAVVDSG